jgi:putative polyhydroxyalkanoate system protein
MPKLTIERSHQLGVDEARERLVALSTRLADKYGLKSSWTTPTEAVVKGTGATGKITCTPGKVSVMIDLSFALTPLKGKIEEKVTKELETALA